MDTKRLSDIRQLAESATEGPALGCDWAEVFIRTDDAHRHADTRLYHNSRAMILELCAEVERLQAETHHDRYTACVSRVLALEAERDALKAQLANVRPADREWLHAAAGVEYVDG